MCLLLGHRSYVTRDKSRANLKASLMYSVSLFLIPKSYSDNFQLHGGCHFAPTDELSVSLYYSDDSRAVVWGFKCFAVFGCDFGTVRLWKTWDSFDKQTFKSSMKQ